MSDIIQIITTFDNYKLAEKVGRTLLEKKLCACFQIIGPIKSLYWWKEKIQDSDEWMCFLKAKSENFKQIEETIKSLHNYEVPEIISLPIFNISKEYLDWINSVN